MFNILKNKVVCIVAVAAFFIYFVFTMVDTGNTIKAHESLLKDYEAGIAQQEEIARALDKQASEIGSNKQIEQLARERLGLCKSNEKLFITQEQE